MISWAEVSRVNREEGKVFGKDVLTVAGVSHVRTESPKEKPRRKEGFGRR